MKSLSKLGIIHVAVTLFVFFITGCSVTYRAKIYAVPSYLEITEFQGQGEGVSIRNGAREGMIPIGKTLPMGGEDYVVGDPDIKRYFTDLKQVTDVAASLLAEELSRKGFSVRRDASKGITLNVTGIYLAYTGWYSTTPTYRCVIEMECKASDGYNRKLRASNLSDYYAMACNSAITNGVIDLLNDEELIDFLTKREIKRKEGD